MIAFVTHNGKQVNSFEVVEPRPSPGDILRFTRTGATMDRSKFEINDTIELLELTNEEPHGWGCTIGNWRAKTQHGVSVWSSIEQGITDGTFEYIKRKPDHERATAYDLINSDFFDDD